MGQKITHFAKIDIKHENWMKNPGESYPEYQLFQEIENKDVEDLEYQFTINEDRLTESQKAWVNDVLSDENGVVVITEDKKVFIYLARSNPFFDMEAYLFTTEEK